MRRRTGYVFLDGRAREWTGRIARLPAVRYVSRVLFAEEFVIDEKPEPVYEPEASAPEAAAGHDLVFAVSEMLRDQVRLSELNEALKSSPREGSDELDRFIRRHLSRMDGFDRILEAFRSMEPSEEVNAWLKSLESLYFKLQNDLESVGLTPFETVGRPVDLNCMEVIDYRPTADYPHNTVIYETKRGYRYKGKVLRDAQVIVACNERK